MQHSVFFQSMRPYCWPAALWWILIKHQMCSSCSINQPWPLQMKHTVPSILQSSCHRLRVIFHTTQHTKHPSLALTLKCSHRQNRVICGRVRVTYYYYYYCVYYFSCSTLWGSSDRKEPCYAICHTKPELNAELRSSTKKHVQIWCSTVTEMGPFGSTTTQCFDLAIWNGSGRW